ncbi:MAG: DUF6036 family nucleotidyltransferase [Nitrosotalea sp.]
MSLDNTRLLDLLGEIDKELTHKIVIVAVGGTAMTLLKAKSSTIDVDFTIPSQYYDDFEHARDIVKPGFQVDLYHDGAVFVNMLPDDYLKRSKLVKTKLTNIELRTLHPVDIVVTKICRLDGRDKQDIESCVKKFHITKSQIIKRARTADSIWHDKTFQKNLIKCSKEILKR